MCLEIFEMVHWGTNGQVKLLFLVGKPGVLVLVLSVLHLFGVPRISSQAKRSNTAL